MLVSRRTSVRFRFAVPFSSKAVVHGHSLSELRSCVKVEVAVLGFPSLTVRTISLNESNTKLEHSLLGGCPGLPVSSPYGLCVDVKQHWTRTPSDCGCVPPQ